MAPLLIPTVVECVKLHFTTQIWHGNSASLTTHGKSADCSKSLMCKCSTAKRICLRLRYYWRVFFNNVACVIYSLCTFQFLLTPCTYTHAFLLLFLLTSPLLSFNLFSFLPFLSLSSFLLSFLLFHFADLCKSLRTGSVNKGCRDPSIESPDYLYQLVSRI